MTRTAAERYLELGLKLGRHVDGLVDAYFGPPELAEAVAAAPPADPKALVAAATALLAELDDGWLRDQAAGLRTYAGVLAGEGRAYADEVEGCYGVRPVHTDEAVFAAAHARLGELLPGAGPLAERYTAWRDSMLVPPDRIEATVTAVMEQARAWTRTLVELPPGDEVEVEFVRDVPWMGFDAYLGGGRSRMSVNLDLPMSALDLLLLVIHETYPGHHAERALKEDLLVRGRGLLEETLVAVPTPQSIVAEGIAVLAPGMVLESEGGPAFAAIIRDAGIAFDLGHTLAVQRAYEPCRRVEVNAALLLHADGASEAETRAYLERHGLMSPEFSAHMIRFLNEPTSRTYVLSYSAGQELCDAYVGGDPGRFRRLLTEQVRVAELIAAGAAAA